MIGRKTRQEIIFFALSAISLFFIYFYLIRPALLGPSRRLFLKKCTTHHSLKRIERLAKHPKHSPWEKIVRRMKKNGAKLTDKEAKRIINYLEKTYP